MPLGCFASLAITVRIVACKDLAPRYQAEG